jgi:hypothetical protein
MEHHEVVCLFISRKEAIRDPNPDWRNESDKIPNATEGKQKIVVTL